MLKLNLISKESHKEIALRRCYFLTRKINFILIILALFLTTLFIGADFIMKKSLQGYLSFSDLYEKSKQKFNDEKVSAINQEITTALLVQEDFFPTSILIKKISDLTSNGIILDHVQFDLEKKAAKIGGLADSRENFLIFKNNLEKSKFLVEINYPLTSILQKQNIEFEISAALDLSELADL